jgi:hypothetical protein
MWTVIKSYLEIRCQTIVELKFLKPEAFSIIKDILPLDEGIMAIITLDQKIITLFFVSVIFSLV